MAGVAVHMWQKDNKAVTYTNNEMGIVEVSIEFMEMLMSLAGFERTTPDEFWADEETDHAECTDPECCP